MRQQFGGNWTERKLECVRQYLSAWTKVMLNQQFQTVYIDAFAGTGYRELRKSSKSQELMLPELADDEPQGFMDGSAKIALTIEPPFNRYIFVEMSRAKAAKLEELQALYPDKQITIQKREANEYLQTICAKPIWDHHRAVLFLDPFGMEVRWDTIEAIATTKAIDLWYLFPLGANRMLTRDGDISEDWQAHLTRLLGTKDWYNAFYQRPREVNLFGEDEVLQKCGSYPVVAEFFVNRLKGVFPGVAENPLTLCNSLGTPLFLLCFAMANPSEKARKAALGIAQHILNMR